MSQANIAFVQSLYAAFGKGDIATIIAGAAPDIDWVVNGSRWVSPTLGAWNGSAGVKNFFEAVGQHLEPDLRRRNSSPPTIMSLSSATPTGRSARMGARSPAIGSISSPSAAARSLNSASSPIPRRSRKPFIGIEPPGVGSGQCVSGPAAFFQASMPPSIWQAVAGPHPARPAPPSPSARRTRSRTAAACRSTGKLVQHAARRRCSPAARIGRMQRARNDAVAFALGPFAQVDQRDVRRPTSPSACSADTAQPRRAISSWCRPTCMLAGTATSIIFGLGSFRLFISST